MALTSADASLDGMLLDPVSGDWYDPQAGSALTQAVAAALPVEVASSGSSFTPVVTRPLRNSPYDRADGRGESDPEGYSAMLAAQSKVSSPTVFGSVVAFAKGGWWRGLNLVALLRALGRHPHRYL